MPGTLVTATDVLWYDGAMETRLCDMHVHLGFMTNAEEVALDAERARTLLFANTVTPEEWSDSRSRFAEFENVRVGFGMHPWWIGDTHGGGISIERVQELLEQHDPRFVGEVGLDFGKRHIKTGDRQIAMFAAIARWAERRKDKLLSVHSVRSAADVLDILEQTGAADCCAIVFHWFTGPSDQLKRAIDRGCYFSVGPRMLATGKGREYVKAIPETRLLLETDAPPQAGVPYTFDELRAELTRAADGVASIKGDAVRETLERTSLELLGASSPT